MKNFFFTLTQKGQLITANSFAVNFFGLKENELGKRTIFDFVYHDDKQSFLNLFESWIKIKVPEFTLENRQVGKNGEVLDIYWKFFVSKNSEGLIERIICEGCDITHSKQAARLDLFTQFTLNQVKTAIFWCNSDGTFFYVNPTACEWLGYSYDELMKLHVADINPEFPKEDWPEHWEEIKAKRIVHMESYHMRKNGVKYPVELHSSYVKFEGEEYKLSFVNDISEKRKADEELNKHRDHLEHLIQEKTKSLDDAIKKLKYKNEIISEQNEVLRTILQDLKETQSQLIQSEKMASLGVLTAGVAHEINNPLNYLMGSYVGLDNFFKNKAPQFKDEVSILLKGIKTGVERASEIVNGLNQFSRKSLAFDEDCDIHSIINNCLVMLHNQYKHKITIEKKYADRDIIIKGNVGKLHQVFINLLANSIQSIDGEGEISVFTEVKDGKIYLGIEDSGRGIKSEDLSKVSDPFYTTKSPGEGTGLGLYLTYNIIREHNGEINFESEFGVGTKVSVVLPI